jgi:hypothetical protein
MSNECDKKSGAVITENNNAGRKNILFLIFNAAANDIFR